MQRSANRIDDVSRRYEGVKVDLLMDSVCWKRRGLPVYVS